MKTTNSWKKGFNLLEVILTVTLFTVFTGAVSFAILSYYQMEKKTRLIIEKSYQEIGQSVTSLLDKDE